MDAGCANVVESKRSCPLWTVLTSPKRPINTQSFAQMKRVQEKIKDFVEAQRVEELRDFASDPARTLAAYRFTDATSDLLARWLDALADLPRGRGAARALAGVRGVGKSHTLAVFGALAAHPELRARAEDAHVATSARRLMNRRYVLVRVRRGTRPTLLEEVAAALGETFGNSFEPEPESLVSAACAHAPDAVVIFLIDTAAERARRVGRNDGPTLSRLAQAAENCNLFIALALDDDIADASGANVVLAGTFQIDYLDPEHLYRIAETHVLRKTPQARAALHELYLNLRAALPGFRWSEQRFIALYPLHPIIADVAASVRLYAQDFAFLPFAAAATERAASRPALSLVLVDELFDRVEPSLRRSEELRDAFAAYDELTKLIAARFPVMQRLEAKLLLKALFVLSLDGRGADEHELCAALLLHDENQPNAASERIADALESFASTSLLDQRRDGDHQRHRFRIDASEDFEEALIEAARNVPPAAVAALWRSIAHNRFADWPFAEEGEARAKLDFVWRGTPRRGEVSWIVDDPSAADALDPLRFDWQLRVLSPEASLSALPPRSVGIVDAVWQPDRPKPEEQEIFRRLVALRTDASLTARFGDAARAALASHTSQAERIWTRAFLDEGKLYINGEATHLSEQARAASSFEDLLRLAFDDRFAALYPQHPTFADILGEAEAANLIEGLFGGFKPNDVQVQKLAHRFAEPLGLVSKRGEAYLLGMGDEMLAPPWTREVMRLVEMANGATVSVQEVFGALRRPPLGLSHEACRLVLAALVASRRIELITAGGDRVTRRTLDRTLRWEEIVGVARAASIMHSAEELTAWARMLTGEEALSSIADPTAREQVRAALTVWLERWRQEALLQRLERLPDFALSTRLWNLIAAVKRSFGSAAEVVEATLADHVPLEEGLQRVADCFADDMHRFVRDRRRLDYLTRLLDGLDRWLRVRAYLCEAERTEVPEIEKLRRDLLAMSDDPFALGDVDWAAEFAELWEKFHAQYIEHYATLHAKTREDEAWPRVLEELLRSPEWREFEALRALSKASAWIEDEAARLLDRARAARACRWPVRETLRHHPRCLCGFRLRDVDAEARFVQDLETLVAAGRAAYRRALAALGSNLTEALRLLAHSEPAGRTADRALALADALEREEASLAFSREDVELIERALQIGATATPVRLRLPDEIFGFVTQDELRARLEQWLNALPQAAALVELEMRVET